jgi:transposase
MWYLLFPVMKHAHKESKAGARVYTSTTLIPDVRTAFARLYLAWKARGQPKSDFLAFLSAAGYDVPLRTLDEWVANVRSQGSATSLAKASGRPHALSETAVRLLVGFVLDRNESNVEVHLDTAQAFVRDRLGLDISLRSLSNYLHDAGFSSKVTQNKTAGFKLDVASLCGLALHWLRTTPLDVPRSRLCSIDFAFSGHRKDLRSSWSPVGGAQPRSGTAVSTYTNCIITCVWADGRNRTPAMLFTYDQKFRRDRSPTEKRKAEVAYLDECLRCYEIDADRIVYVGKEKGENRTFVAESADLVRRFFETYGVEKDCTVLSDNGNAFKDDGVDIFEALGFKQHRSYPAAVHQYLSPNDNRLHGAAKKAWTESMVDFSDDVLACCYLLNLLDWCNKDVRKWFSTNLQLKEEEPTLERIEALIKSERVSESEYYKECLGEYRVFAGQDA